MFLFEYCYSYSMAFDGCLIKDYLLTYLCNNGLSHFYELSEYERCVAPHCVSKHPRYYRL